MKDAVAAVQWLLEQQEPEARRVAVQQVAKIDGRDGAELIVRALGDEDWRVRKEAARVAASVEPRDVMIAALVAALDEHDNIGLRNAAVEALAGVGADAVPATIEALSRLDADGRKLCVEALGGFPELAAVRALAHALADEDANVRVASAEALGNAAHAGEEARAIATSSLADALSASEMFLKLAALDALARLDAKLPWSVFAPYADDPVLRRYAIAAAAGSREPAAIRALAKAVGDGSPTIAREAAIALADCVLAGVRDAHVLDEARADLRTHRSARERLHVMAGGGDDIRERAAALLLLGLLADPADVGLLVEALADDDVSARAELALMLFGESVVEPLVHAAKKSMPHVRAEILALVASLGATRAHAAHAAFREALADPAPEVVAAAAKGLSVAGDAVDLARVAVLVTHTDPRVSTSASNAVALIAERHAVEARALLARTDPAGSDAAVGCALLRAASVREPSNVAFLERALAHADARVRRAAVDALAQLGAADAADAVSFALADEERDVQLAAVRALGQLRVGAPLVDVVSAARDPGLVAAALRALGDADGDLAFGAAHPLLKHADPSIASSAVEAIGRLGPRRKDAIFEALDHPDVDVVKSALAEIALDLDARSLARLGLCLDHISWEVRRLAAELLGSDGSPSAQALLRARYEREKDPVVREAIAEAVSVRPPADGFPTLTAPPARDEDAEANARSKKGG
jgi:HEAT repeat protein